MLQKGFIDFEDETLRMSKNNMHLQNETDALKCTWWSICLRPTVGYNKHIKLSNNSIFRTKSRK